MKAVSDKKPNRPPLRIVIRYFLLQLPGQAAFVLILLFLRQQVDFPAYLTWMLLGLWVGKDIFLFPVLWRFYDRNQYPDRFRMVGRQGIALTPLNPCGYVRVRGERWQACIDDGQTPIEKGASICVAAVTGLKLTVKACIP